MNTSWMSQCHDCVRLLGAYDRAHTPEDVTGTRRAVVLHLAAKHHDRLTAGRDCTKCAEFTRALNLRPGLLTPTIRGVLTRADDEHRAEHLIVATVSGSRAAAA